MRFVNQMTYRRPKQAFVSETKSSAADTILNDTFLLYYY